MLSGAFLLSSLAAVPATFPSAAAAASQAASQPATTLADDILWGGLITWFVIACFALLKLDIFKPKSFQSAPARTAVALLPVTGGVLVLYFAFQIIAIQIALAAGLFSPQSIGLPPPTTTTAATASAPATLAATAPAPDPSNSPEERMRLQTVAAGAELAAMLLAVLLAQALFVDGVRGLGLSPKQLPTGLALGALGYFALYPLLFAEGILLSYLYQKGGHEITVHETIHDIEIAPSISIKIVFSLIAGIGAPIAEEIFFRGFLQTSLIQEAYGFIIQMPPDRTYRPALPQRWAAIVITSVCFCALHLNFDHFPILFLLSVGLGYLYERTGNLWAPITFHALFNASSLIPLFFS